MAGGLTIQNPSGAIQQVPNPVNVATVTQSEPGSASPPPLVLWGAISGNILNQIDLQQEFALKADLATLNTHINDHANPHQVNKAQVGLPLVDNIAAMNMPMSIPQQAYVAAALTGPVPSITIVASQVSDSTATGRAVLTGSAAAGRTALGSSASGDSVFTGTPAQGRTALGSSASGDTVFTGTAAQGRTALGSGAVGDPLFTAATAAAARTTLGANASGSTIFTSASAFGATLAQTADAQAARTALVVNNQPTFRNFVDVGDFSIAQHGTPAITTSGAFFCDRWAAANTATNRVSVQVSGTNPAPGYTTHALVTVNSAGAPAGNDQYGLFQSVEGYMIKNFNYGLATARPTFVSFWVRCSVAGNYAFAIRNDVPNRSFVQTFNVAAPNTWEYKTISIPAETAGTWLVTFNRGAYFQFSAAAGPTISTSTLGSWQAGNFVGATGQTQLTSTAAATFQVTGVQWEPGVVATPYEEIPFDRMIRRCWRYYFTSYPLGLAAGTPNSLASWHGITASVNELVAHPPFPEIMRAVPSLGIYNDATGVLGATRSMSSGTSVNLTAVNVSETKLFSVTSAGGYVASIPYAYHITADARI